MNIKSQTFGKERLRIISTHTKFKGVSTNTTICTAYNVHLYFSENFEIFFRPLAEMTPVVPKWAEFGQNQKYQKIRKTKLGKVTKFQKATTNGLGVIKNNPWGGQFSICCMQNASQ